MTIKDKVRDMFDHLKQVHGVTFGAGELWKLSKGDLYDTLDKLDQKHRIDYPGCSR